MQVVMQLLHCNGLRAHVKLPVLALLGNLQAQRCLADCSRLSLLHAAWNRKVLSVFMGRAQMPHIHSIVF